MVRGSSIVVEGTVEPKETEILVEIISSGDGGDTSKTVRSDAGEWRARVALRGSEPEKTIMASLTDADVFDTRDIEYRSGPTPDQLYNNRQRLLARQGAIGKSTGQIRRALGAPDRKQRVAGEIYWYYEDSSNVYQLVFSGGVVVQVNAY